MSQASLLHSPMQSNAREEQHLRASTAVEEAGVASSDVVIRAKGVSVFYAAGPPEAQPRVVRRQLGRMQVERGLVSRRGLGEHRRHGPFPP